MDDINVKLEENVQPVSNEEEVRNLWLPSQAQRENGCEDEIKSEPLSPEKKKSRKEKRKESL